MVTQVEFIILENTSQWLAITVEALDQMHAKFSRILFIADDRDKVEQLDEYLWHNSHEVFIPNSLEGECFSSTSNVLLTDNQPEGKRFQALINLSGNRLTNPQQYLSIVELVKTEEENKEQARCLFKSYRQLGFQVHHRDLATRYE